METSETFTVQMTAEQKELFNRWLYAREKELEVKMESLRSLRRQISRHEPATVVEKESKLMKSRDQSWTSKTYEVIKQSGQALTSTQIIAWLMEHDKELQGRDKRYITKNVTSKLALLVEKGRLEKQVREGKNFYALKGQASWLSILYKQYRLEKPDKARKGYKKE
jgi:hypothetical protein